MKFRLLKVMAPEGAPAGAGVTPPAAPPPPPVLGSAPPVAPPVVTPPPAGEGYPAGDWRATLPDDLKQEPSLKVIHSVEAMTKSYINAQKAIGADKVVLPGKHATDEDWQKFYDATGRPALDKYELPEIKDARVVTKENLNALKPIAHKLGVNPKQLEPVLNWFEQNLANSEKAKADQSTAAQLESLRGLQTEWGKAFEQKSAWAARVIAEDMGADGLKFMKDHPEFGNNPLLIKYFAKVGEDRYKEDKVLNPGGGKGIPTPVEAIRQVNDILAQGTAHPYGNVDHPNHKAAVADVQELMNSAYPDQKDV